MPTTADYLTDLTNQRDALAANLITKGVAASNTEKFGTLVPKVLNISNYKTGVFTPADNTAEFSATGLSESPGKFMLYTIRNPKTPEDENTYHVSIYLFDFQWDATAFVATAFVRSIDPTYLPTNRYVTNSILNDMVTMSNRYVSYNNGTLSINFNNRSTLNVVFSGGTTYKWIIW